MARYKVVGLHAVAGVAPGGTVDLDESATNVEALVRAGHVKPMRTGGRIVLPAESGPELVSRSPADIAERPQDGER